MPSAEEIPIVDLGELGLLEDAGNFREESVNRVANELDAAFSTVGFVYLKNHGIPQEKIVRVFRSSQTFFALPLNEKNRIKRELNKNDGYIGQNQEMLDSNNHEEIREAFNCTSPDNGGFYPDDSVPEFRLAVCALVPALCELTRRLLKCMAVALGLEEDFYIQRHRFMFEGPTRNATTFRSLYYPSLVNYADDELIKPGVVRCGQHSDYGTITLLLQNDLGGLEVLSKEQWISASPIKDTILINLGDLMQFWTSGRYKATVHRVLVPEEEIRRRSHRQSLALFVHPDNDVMVSPLDGADVNTHPPISALDYLKSRLSASYKF